MGSHVLLQGIFPTQGLNPALLCLLHRRQILHHWATREALVCNVVLLKLPKFINPYNEYWIPIISRVLYTVNDIDIDKCFVLFLSFQRNLYLHSGLKDSMCYPSTVCFFSKYKQFYPFQFILVTSSRSLISIQIYQNLSLEIFLNFVFSLILHSLISISYFPLDIRTTHRWMWGSALYVISLCTEEIILLGEARQPASSASLGVSS